jgi:hypothetical protein
MRLSFLREERRDLVDPCALPSQASNAAAAAWAIVGRKVLFRDQRRAVRMRDPVVFEGVDGTRIQVDAPYPKDFQVLVQQLEKNV